MHLAALTHLTSAVQGLANCENIVVLGSAALLATAPELGAGHGPLQLTRDADLLVTPSDGALAAMLHEALGEGSLFDARFGYHVDILRPEIVDSLPRGWESRLVAIPGATARALSVSDVAAVKCAVWRPKDREVVQVLLDLGLVDRGTLIDRIGQVVESERDKRRVMAHVAELAAR